MRILFCNIGWMEQYQGLNAQDQISGGGAYVQQQGRGHEVCNFSPYKHQLYGYVQAPGAQINLNRLGGCDEDEYLGGITVVWTATHPDGGTTIVGWYKDATVFRDYQPFTTTPPTHFQNGIDGYRITAPAQSATLLPVDARTFEIPRQVKGGMGQSNIWYADVPESQTTVTAVSTLINGKGLSRKKTKTQAPQNQERKVQIEKKAIRICSDYFERLGYAVTSVETDNIGWDLNATSGRRSLRIEVKGLSGQEFSVELTPNEYHAFAQQKSDYRLAVVINALTSPALFICRYSKEYEAWIVEGSNGQTLDIKIIQSASITLTR